MSRINLYAVLLSVVIISCNNEEKKSTMKTLNTILDNYYEDRLQLFPLEATAIADNRYNDKLPADISNSYRKQLKGFYENYLDEISRIDKSKLSDQELLSYEVFKKELNIQLEGLSYKDNLMPVNQFWGMHLSFPLLGSGSGNQPFKTVKDYEDFLKRINDFSVYVDSMIANMEEGIKEKIVPPAILMERVLPQLKGIIVTDPEKSVFYAPVKDMPLTFTQADRNRLTSEYKKAIMDKVVSSYTRLYDFISRDYIQHCRKTAGISEVPEGLDYYNYQIRVWTTTNLTADEIFQIGEKEVARIRSEMEGVMKATGFQGDLKAFFHFIHTDKKFMPFKKDSEVIEAYKAIGEKMKPQLSKLFNLVPKAKFEVRQTEKFREASGSAEYQQSAPDGSRPGIFYVPVIDATKFNTVSMEDLFLHEAIPGHHYQVSIQQENDSLPKFRRFGWNGAYGEGWALYTEALGKELGLYTDPYQYFGSLSEEMHRAIRLVVDVGIHTKGWTREQAIAYSLENEAESEADITAEIERYMAIPGQALAYKIGQLKILEIRKRAEEKLGNKFDIKSFHDEVLKDGCLPLDIFEVKMNRWIEKQQKTT
jgi:uncharacterized protein (DUF885 family)